jgi:peptidoglycan hydrolase-like amidase
MHRILQLLCFALVLITIPGHSATVRIGVFTLFHPKELDILPAKGSVLVLHYENGRRILNGERGHWQSTFVLASGAVRDSRFAGISRDVRVTSRDGGPADFILRVPGKISRHYRGELLVAANTQELVPILIIDLETAVASIVAAESLPGAGLEALKAQAVVTRSFLLAGGRHQLFDFCDTTHCQFLREPPAADNPASIAARSTQGMTLAWHGRTLAAMYSSRCGGKTHSLHELQSEVEGYPYFSVLCAWCLRHPFSWQRSFDRQTASRIERPSERERLKLGRQFGWSALPSNQYTVTSATEDSVVVKGQGTGSGVGLCQYGAAGMAAEGSSFQKILAHYYPETEIKTASSQKTQQGLMP